VSAGAGAGFVCGGCTGVGVCRDGARCEVSAGVGLGLGEGEGEGKGEGEGEGEVAGAGAGVGAGQGGGCDRTRAGKGRNVESSTNMLGACVTMGYEDAGK
jgi:hypothetical protein